MLLFNVWRWTGVIIFQIILVTFIFRVCSNFPIQWRAGESPVSAERVEWKVSGIKLSNGDVSSVSEGRTRAKTCGLNGVMLGRAIFDNPWLFEAEQRERTQDEKMALLWQHAELFDQIWGRSKNFQALRHYYCIYAKGFPGASALRAQLMQTESTDDVRRILNQKGFAGCEG